MGSAGAGICKIWYVVREWLEAAIRNDDANQSMKMNSCLLTEAMPHSKENIQYV